MSKLSPSIKALINAPFARPGPVPAPAIIRDVFQGIAQDAARHKLSTRPWLALSTAATFTLNSPDSLNILYSVASSARDTNEVQVAELMREVGLKCISFNGIARSINGLNAFHASLPEHVTRQLATRQPSRVPTPQNLDATLQRGRQLWDVIYAPFEKKLVDKLAAAHPDLPVHILTSHYGPLLADPPPEDKKGQQQQQQHTGRALTSLVAIACLRAQTGVGPQVLSHVFGLRKQYEDGSYLREMPRETEEGMAWMASDEGLEWILKAVDRIQSALEGRRAAPQGGRDSKL